MSNSSQGQLPAKLINAQDDERRRIADDLRGRAGEYLAALAINLSVLLRENATLTTSQKSRLSDALQMVHRCASEIRAISSLLNPPSLNEEGLFTAITWYLEGFAQRSGIRVDFDCSPELGRFPHEVEMAIFRIVQEGLTNVERHSGSASATIRMTESAGTLHVEIRDEGRGISPETLSGILLGTHLAGVGMAGMRERARMLGGTFRVRSDEQGTSLELSVPVASQLLRT